MRQFKADLHIHSLLSPCGSLEMSPINIVQAALNAQLDIIAITDHNSTKQAPLIKKMGAEKGLFVVCGAEINSKEEVHCLTLFETAEQLIEFQQFIDRHLLPIKNKPKLFGDQVVVDEEEMIVEEVKYLLISALDATLLEIEQNVHRLGGLVIPAHVDRPFNGLFSQLGFLPEDLHVDAFELSKNANIREWQLNGKIPEGKAIIRNSDAHFPEQIGQGRTIFEMEEASFKEIARALRGEQGRNVKNNL
jgi:PHP family Zn ribbon phosphoesterase